MRLRQEGLARPVFPKLCLVCDRPVPSWRSKSARSKYCSNVCKWSPTPRFWARVEKTSACWLWRGARYINGYGKLRARGREQYAHRFSYELANGSIPVGLSVCHWCDIPLCARPDHLFLGDQAANSRDMHQKGRAAPPPHPRGEAHPGAKLTVGAVNEMRAIIAAGERDLSSVGYKFGVNRRTVRDVLSGRTWSHVPFAKIVSRPWRSKG